MLFVGARFSSLYTATVRDPKPELPASGVTKSKEEEEEEEEEEKEEKEEEEKEDAPFLSISLSLSGAPSVSLGHRAFIAAETPPGSQCTSQAQHHL